MYRWHGSRSGEPNDVRIKLIAGTERDERLLRLLHSAYRLLQAKYTQRALQQREKSGLHGPDAIGRQRRRLAFQRLRRRIRHRSVLLSYTFLLRKNSCVTLRYVAVWNAGNQQLRRIFSFSVVGVVLNRFSRSGWSVAGTCCRRWSFNTCCCLLSDNAGNCGYCSRRRVALRMSCTCHVQRSVDDRRHQPSHTSHKHFRTGQRYTSEILARGMTAADNHWL